MHKKTAIKDPFSGEEFIPKKITQRFKTPSNQIKFNNQLQSRRRQFLGMILKPLNRTHRILTKALGESSSVRLHKEWLKGAGADMTLFTHIEKMDNVNFKAIFNIAISVKEEYYIIQKIGNYENGNL